MKQALGLIIGILVGAAGAILFSRSQPPEEGSTEERLEIAQKDLRKAERNLARLEGLTGRNRGPRGVRDGVLDIAQNIREGKEVSMDDVFATMKPWMRDMSPLFNRIREIEEEERIDGMMGEWTRRFDLNPAEQETLRKWLTAQSRKKSEAIHAVLHSNSSGFVDYVLASQRDWNEDRGIDTVMEGFLEGDELSTFREERLQERATSVENEANRGVDRLNQIVELDEEQQDKVFGIFARGARDFEPGVMDFEGVTGDRERLDIEAREAALREVMRPDQRTVFDKHLAEKESERTWEMQRLGLTPPRDWKKLEDGNL